MPFFARKKSPAPVNGRLARVSQTCKSGKAAGLKCSDPGDTQHQRRVANGYHKPNGGVAMTTDGPRRHTVSGVDTVQRRNGGHDPPPPEVQKEVIYDHLACRYPEHAHIIQQQRNGQENARSSTIQLDRLLSLSFGPLTIEGASLSSPSWTTLGKHPCAPQSECCNCAVETQYIR
ncbi:hypothetical protein CAPTEDRAFT_206586 [Capitella teleta]|uniref:Uncharacterized protein n=1 Tax=Capitella teleta TaxID=283909 RepID=R7U3C3_CAPTE|nr:hypothetical protein CAPTEDRAFT_206586 [Capitella teleta]|eukprot:ELU00621.1 hypothetical protein CAPTEDRAFT_206586 [Capitella teleta]